MRYLILILSLAGCAINPRIAPSHIPSDARDGQNGQDGTDGRDGKKGSDGTRGQDGSNGSDGHSAVFSQGVAELTLCSNGGIVLSLGLDLNDDLILQDAETQSIAVICNGLNGSDGVDGVDGIDAPISPFMPVDIVNPCGDSPSIDDEIFFRLANGLLVWSQSDNSNGKNTRFSVGRPGTWQTTDGDGCIFLLDSNLNITYENHHY